MQHPFDDFDPLAHVSGTDFKLLHLLTCADCRSRAINRLLEASIAAEEDTWVDYEPLLARLGEVDPARLEEARAAPAPPFAALELGLDAIRTLGQCTEESGMAFEESVKVISATLRRTLRSCGLPMKPLPFA